MWFLQSRIFFVTAAQRMLVTGTEHDDAEDRMRKKPANGARFRSFCLCHLCFALSSPASSISLLAAVFLVLPSSPPFISQSPPPSLRGTLLMPSHTRRHRPWPMCPLVLRTSAMHTQQLVRLFQASRCRAYYCSTVLLFLSVDNTILWPHITSARNISLRFLRYFILIEAILQAG